MLVSWQRSPLQSDFQFHRSLNRHPRSQNSRKSMKNHGFDRDPGVVGGPHGTQSNPAEHLTSSHKGTAVVPAEFSGSLIIHHCRMASLTSLQWRMIRDPENSAGTTAALLSQRVNRLVSLLHTSWDRREHAYLRSRQLFRADFRYFRCEDGDCNLGGDSKHFPGGCAASQLTPRLAITKVYTTLAPGVPPGLSSRSIFTAKAIHGMMYFPLISDCGT